MLVWFNTDGTGLDWFHSIYQDQGHPFFQQVTCHRQALAILKQAGICKEGCGGRTWTMELRHVNLWETFSDFWASALVKLPEHFR